MLYKLRNICNTAVAYTVFLSGMSIFQPGTYLYFLFGKRSEHKRTALHKFIRRMTSWAARRMPGVSFSVDNPRGESFDKPAVIICNHQSHLDLVYILSLSHKMVFLTNDWVWRCPFYNIIIHRAEFYPVSNGMENNLPKLKSLVDRGYSIVVFPEGTRSVDCSVLRFHQGAFALAQELGVDLLPLTLYGTGKVLRKHTYSLKPGHVHIAVGERFAPSSPLLAQAREMRARYKEEYRRLCEEYDKVTEACQRKSS